MWIRLNKKWKLETFLFDGLFFLFHVHETYTNHINSLDSNLFKSKIYIMIVSFPCIFYCMYYYFYSSKCTDCHDMANKIRKQAYMLIYKSSHTNTFTLIENTHKITKKPDILQIILFSLLDCFWQRFLKANPSTLQVYLIFIDIFTSRKVSIITQPFFVHKHSSS